MPAKYYGKGGAYAASGERSSASGVSQNLRNSASRRKEYAAAVAALSARSSTVPIKTTGQWQAGVLSQADTKTTTQSVAQPITTAFTTLPSGKTGSIVDRTSPYFALSEGFANKASTSGVSVSLNSQGVPTLTPNIDYSNIYGEGAVYNPTSANQFTPKVSGNNPFVPQMSSDMQQMLNPQMPQPPVETSVFGANVDRVATNLVNGAFNFIDRLGGGDFQRGIYSLLTMPATAGTSMISGTTKTGAYVVDGMTPAIITDKTLKTGGVQTLNNVKLWISKLFTKEKLIEYINPTTRATKQVIVREPINLRGTLLLTGVISSLGLLAYAITSSLGGYGTGIRDVEEEGGGMLMTFARDMCRDGNYEMCNAFLDMAEKATNETVSRLPFGINVAEGAKKYADMVNQAIPMLRQHYATIQELDNEGKNASIDADYWLSYNTKIEELKTAEDKKRTDYYNQQRLIVDAQIRASEAQSRKDAAEYWLNYRRQIAEMEKKMQEEQAKFWLEYRKLIMKMQSENQRSTLSFGLL